MKKALTLIFTVVFLSGIYAQDKWKVDESHTSIRFSVPHMVVSEAEGVFNDFSGTVTNAGDDFVGANVTFTAQVSSIDTDNEKRDGHLKSEDFFYAEKYPEVKFEGKLVKEGEDYFLDGKFTMRGVTKEKRFPVSYNGMIDTGRGKKAGFKVMGTVDRKEYGLEWSKTVEAGPVVGDEVSIECKVELDSVQ